MSTFNEFEGLMKKVVSRHLFEGTGGNGGIRDKRQLG
jgi:hypothetical protein